MFLSRYNCDLDALARVRDVLERRQRTGVIRSRAILGRLHHHYGQILGFRYTQTIDLYRKPQSELQTKADCRVEVVGVEEAAGQPPIHLRIH